MGIENRSSIDKISGATPDQKETIERQFSNAFENPERSTTYERKKTPEEQKVIEETISVTADFLKEYGAKSLTITADHVHILDESKLTEDELVDFKKRYPTSKAFYRPGGQDIWIFSSKIKSPLTLARVVAHELIHFIAFNALIIDRDGVGRIHRLGLAVDNAESDFGKTPGLNLFNETNEATTEGLVKRLFPRLGQLSSLAKEYEEVKEMQTRNDDLAYINVTERPTDSGIVYDAEVETFGYPEVRQADEQLFTEILRQHPDQFKSEEEVFAVFARAAMTGNVKEMASLVESLGRGAFRSLARRETPKGE